MLLCVHPSLSLCVYVCVCACVCMLFYNRCRIRGSCFRLVSPRNSSRILARGLQVAYGACLGENDISDPFTPILRPLQYYIFSVGSSCHGVVTSYPHSTFNIIFISRMIYIPLPVPILMRISMF